MNRAWSHRPNRTSRWTRSAPSMLRDCPATSLPNTDWHERPQAYKDKWMPVLPLGLSLSLSLCLALWRLKCLWMPRLHPAQKAACSWDATRTGSATPRGDSHHMWRKGAALLPTLLARRLPPMMREVDPHSNYNRRSNGDTWRPWPTS